MNFSDLSAAEKIIGYTFKNKELLKRCFTHSSYVGGDGFLSNERLEFLGDKVLDLVIAEDLCLKHTEFSAGGLTNEKQYIVSKKPLAEAVKILGLNKFLLTGGGQSPETLSQKGNSDLFEAIAGGIYLDGGLKSAKKFILSNIKKMPFEASSKSRLQEYLQKYKLGEPKYILVKKSGPDHNPDFEMRVEVNAKPVAKGSGKTKQEAEAKAAKRALAIYLKGANGEF